MRASAAGIPTQKSPAIEIAAGITTLPAQKYGYLCNTAFLFLHFI